MSVGPRLSVVIPWYGKASDVPDVLERVRSALKPVAEEGGYEIVDFKSGEAGVVPELDQLTIYAAALGKICALPEGDLTLTYAYLRSGTTVSRTITRFEAEDALRRLEERLSAAVGA